MTIFPQLVALPATSTAPYRVGLHLRLIAQAEQRRLDTGSHRGQPRPDRAEHLAVCIAGVVNASSGHPGQCRTHLIGAMPGDDDNLRQPGSLQRRDRPAQRPCARPTAG